MKNPNCITLLAIHYEFDHILANIPHASACIYVRAFLCRFLIVCLSEEVCTCMYVYVWMSLEPLISC